MSFLINNISSTPPIGSISAYLGTSDPAGWIICDGVLRTSTDSRYSAVLSMGIGAGTANSYTPPNLTGKMLYGKQNNNNIKDSIGASSVTLSTNNLPSHNHTVPAHNHTVSETAHTHTITVSDSGHTHSNTLTNGTHSHTVTANQDAHNHSITWKNQQTDETLGGGDAFRYPLLEGTGDNSNADLTKNTNNADPDITVSCANATVSITNASATTGITASSSSANTNITINNNSSQTTDNTGSASSFDIIPPSYVINWILKL